MTFEHVGSRGRPRWTGVITRFQTIASAEPCDTLQNFWKNHRFGWDILGHCLNLCSLSGGRSVGSARRSGESQPVLSSRGASELTLIKFYDMTVDLIEIDAELGEETGGDAD
jgi:hypothetical protein